MQAGQFEKQHALIPLFKEPKQLPQNLQRTYQHYAEKVKEAALRRKVLHLESTRSGEKLTQVEGFSSYQKACSDRNSQAYAIFHRPGIFQQEFFTEEGLLALEKYCAGFERSVTPLPVLREQAKLSDKLIRKIEKYQQQIEKVMALRKELVLKEDPSKKDFQKLGAYSSKRNKTAFHILSSLQKQKIDPESICFDRACHTLKIQARLHEKGTREVAIFKQEAASLPEDMRTILSQYEKAYESVASYRNELIELTFKNPNTYLINEPAYIYCRNKEAYRNKLASVLFRQLKDASIDPKTVFSPDGEKIVRSHADQDEKQLALEKGNTQAISFAEKKQPLSPEKKGYETNQKSQRQRRTHESPKKAAEESHNKASATKKTVISIKKRSPVENSSKTLSPKQKELLDSFIEKDKKTYDLYRQVNQEKDKRGGLIKDQSSFPKWQQACGERNKSAYFLSSAWTKEELSSRFNKREVQAIAAQSERYLQTERKLRIYQNEQKQRSEAIKYALVKDIDHLADFLFGDQVNQKMSNAQYIRIGAKGEIRISRDHGGFSHFETGEKGDVIKLIETATETSRGGAWKTAAQYLGLGEGKTQLPRIEVKRPQIQPASKWTSFAPSEKSPPPHFEDIPQFRGNQYVTHHDYKSEEGKILFRVFRLKDSEGNKQIRIFSYGSFSHHPDVKFWDNKHPSNPSLYNLDLLAKNKAATVIVVEGEKAADYASKNKAIFFPHQNLVFTTWKGGASNHRKTDWSPLAGRDVIIWPDNDAAGKQAGKNIADTLLFTAGSKTVKLVQPKEFFKECPPSQVDKWDLADPLPETITPKDLSAALRNGIPLHLLRDSVLKKLRLFTADPSEKKMVGDIVHRYECFHKEEINSRIEHARSNYDKREALKKPAQEIVDLIKNENELVDHFVKQPALSIGSPEKDHALAKKIARQCTLHKIQTGENPNSDQILVMRNVIHGFCQSNAAMEKSEQPSFKLAEQRTLEEFCRKSLQQGRLIDPNDYKEAARKVTMETKMAEQQKAYEENQIEQQRYSKGFSW